MANNILSYDANSTQQYLKTTEVGGVHTAHHIVDSMPAVEITGTVSTGALTNTELRAEAVPVSGSLGGGDITLDAWGIQKVSLPHSLFHGMWTFDIPQSMWFMYHNGAEQTTSTAITSVNGAAKLLTTVTDHTLVMESRECPRYQPNRGHLFSSALIAPGSALDGEREWGVGTDENRIVFRKTPTALYAVLRSNDDETGTVVEVDTSGIAGFDVEKGNVYDIQYQWRGVGNYKFFVNLQLVHTFQLLGTLSALSVENPALPVRFSAKRTTEDVSLIIGCADITSENGNDDREQPGFASNSLGAGNHTDTPLLAIFNPLTIDGKTNTRTIVLDSTTVNSSIKATFKVWVTRDATAFTGGTFAAIAGTGSLVQHNYEATAVDTAKLRAIAVIQAEGSVRQIERFTDNPRIKFTLVRGDYLVVTRTAASGTSNAVVRWGEEI